MSNSKRISWRLQEARAAFCGALMLLSPVLSQAALQARLEQGAASPGSTVTLDIESDDAPAGAQPDLAPLQKDFVVLGSATQSVTSIVNGRRSERMRWSVRLQPRHEGKLVIPSIALGHERTAPLDVDVGAVSPQAAADLAEHVFVEVNAGAEDHSIYVQQQTPYTVRLYYDDTVQSGELAAPDPADAVVEQLGADKHGTAMRNGRSYSVIERSYAIAPEKSGTLRIPPVRFNGSQVLPQSAKSQGQVDDADPGNDLFERMLRQSPLGSDPLFKRFAAGAPFGDAAQPVTVEGKEVVLRVKPRPAAAPAGWLPAETITLHDSWQDSPPQFKAGEPATRTITIEAKGLSGSQIPPLSLAQPANARLYPEAADHQSRTDGKTIFGVSTQKITYIPNARGRLDVPVVELNWWDIGSDQPRTAALPATSYVVAPGVAADTTTAGAPGQPTPTLSPSTASPSLGKASEAWNAARIDPRVGILASVLLVALLVALGLATGRRLPPRKQRADAANAATARTPSEAAILRSLQRACLANDLHAAASALLDLGRLQWPDDPPRGLGALALRLEAGAAEVGALERSLYGAEEASPSWGEALWRAMRRGLRARRGKPALHEDGLTPLYPLHRPRMPRACKATAWAAPAALE